MRFEDAIKWLDKIKAGETPTFYEYRPEANMYYVYPICNAKQRAGYVLFETETEWIKHTLLWDNKPQCVEYAEECIKRTRHILTMHTNEFLRANFVFHSSKKPRLRNIQYSNDYEEMVERKRAKKHLRAAQKVAKSA